MRTLMLAAAAAAMLLSGLAPWSGAAAAPAGAAKPPATANVSRAEGAACRGWGRWCGPGFVRACGPYRCWCRPCY